MGRSQWLDITSRVSLSWNSFPKNLAFGLLLLGWTLLLRILLSPATKLRDLTLQFYEVTDWRMLSLFVLLFLFSAIYEYSVINNDCHKSWETSHFSSTRLQTGECCACLFYCFYSLPYEDVKVRITISIFVSRLWSLSAIEVEVSISYWSIFSWTWIQNIWNYNNLIHQLVLSFKITW